MSPYVAWLTFATALTGKILQMNQNPKVPVPAHFHKTACTSHPLLALYATQGHAECMQSLVCNPGACTHHQPVLSR